MVGVILFLFGVLIGITAMWLVQHSAHHSASREHIGEAHYEPVRRVVVAHLRSHGTINLRQLERMVDLPTHRISSFLNQMIADRHIIRHGHGDDGAFFTLMLR